MPETTFSIKLAKVNNLVHLFNTNVFSLFSLFPVSEDCVIDQMSSRIAQKYKNTSSEVNFANIRVVV